MLTRRRPPATATASGARQLMVRKCGREARAGARREGIRSSTRLRPRPSVRGELGQGGGGLQGGAPVGMTSSSHPKMPCSPKNKSPNLQGKHEQKKKSVRNREIQLLVAAISILVGHSTLIVWRGQCVRMRPHCTRCSMRERGCHREKTERKREQSGSIPAPRRASCRLQGSRAPRPLRP
jgi:hypothetical protein